MGRPSAPDLPAPEDFQPTAPLSGVGGGIAQPQAPRSVDRLSDALSRFSRNMTSVAAAFAPTAEERKAKIDAMAAQMKADAIASDEMPDRTKISQSEFNVRTAQEGTLAAQAINAEMATRFNALKGSNISQAQQDEIIQGSYDEFTKEHSFRNEPMFITQAQELTEKKAAEYRGLIEESNRALHIEGVNRGLFTMAGGYLESAAMGSDTAPEELELLDNHLTLAIAAGQPADEAADAVASAFIANAELTNNEEGLDALLKPLPVSGRILANTPKLVLAVDKAREGIRADKESAEQRAYQRGQRADEENFQAIHARILEARVNGQEPSPQDLLAAEKAKPGSSANIVEFGERISVGKHSEIIALDLHRRSLDINNLPTSEEINTKLSGGEISLTEAKGVVENTARTLNSSEFFGSPEWNAINVPFTNALEDVSSITIQSIGFGSQRIEIGSARQKADIRSRWVAGIRDMQADPDFNALGPQEQLKKQQDFQNDLLKPLYEEQERKRLESDAGLGDIPTAVGEKAELEADAAAKAISVRAKELKGYMRAIEQTGLVPFAAHKEFGTDNLEEVNAAIIKEMLQYSPEGKPK